MLLKCKILNKNNSDFSNSSGVIGCCEEKHQPIVDLILSHFTVIFDLKSSQYV
jgi:hypothetical protein